MSSNRKSIFISVPEFKPDPSPLNVSFSDGQLKLVGNYDRLLNFILTLSCKYFFSLEGGEASTPKALTIFKCVNRPNDIVEMTSERAIALIQLLQQKNHITEIEKNNFIAAINGTANLENQMSRLRL